MSEPSEKEKAYRRMAMEKVRSDVRAYVQKGQTKGMSHLGEYPKTMEDAVRTIIALQDLLEESMDKHQKATGHLMDCQREGESVTQAANMLLHGAALHQHDLEGKMARLERLVEQQAVENKELYSHIGQWQDRALKAENALFEADQLRDAHKMVLRSALNEEGLG